MYISLPIKNNHMLKAIMYFILIIFPVLVFAQPNVKDKYLQKFTEIGIQAGVAGYAGDLGGPLGSEGWRNFSAQLFRPMFNINATHRMSEWASFRPGITVARIAGDDNITGDENLSQRNLNFRSLIAEFSFLADVNPLYIFNAYRGKDHNFYPYVSVGLGAFYFNPQANLYGKWHNLKPLRLEGQGFPEYPGRTQYSKVQVNIPLGAGFKYYVSPKYYVGFEGMVRRTFNDYIDDVSTTYIDPVLFDKYLSAENATLAKELYRRDTRGTGSGTIRGNPRNDDYYFTLGLRFGMVIKY